MCIYKHYFGIVCIFAYPCLVATYRENRKKETVWVAIKDNRVVHVNKNLKHLCIHMTKETGMIFSRDTLTRKDSGYIEYKGYVLQKVRLY